MVPAVIAVSLIGLFLYFAINRKDSIRKNNLTAFTALSVFGLIGYEVIFIITG